MAGIVGVYSREYATRKAYYALVNTQTRGQENCGISAAGQRSMRTLTGKRLLSSVFHKNVLKSFIHPTDYAAIGHVGDKKVERDDITPIELDFEDEYKLSVAGDIIILNHKDVDKEFNFKTNTDEELFGRLFHKYLSDLNDIEDAAEATMNSLEKAYYSLGMIIYDENRGSEIIGLRDKRGVKPMYMAANKDTVVFTSESGAIENLELFESPMAEKRDIKPGEMVRANPFNSYSKQLVESKPKHCAFEWVYTSRPDAIIEGKTSHEVRKKLGEHLVETYNITSDYVDVVTGTPDSGRSVALGIANASGIKFDEAITKNQYIGRTYIIPDPKQRHTAAMLKHNSIKDVVKNKRVIIGDDSIVRGSISEALAAVLINAGAKQVDLAISYAPIFYPCYNDEPNKKLAATGMQDLDVFEIGKKVGEKLPNIRKVMYNTVDSVVDSIGIPKEHLCTRCITGEEIFD